MSSDQRHTLIGRRLWSIALSGTVLAVAAAAPSGALAAAPGKHHRGKAPRAQGNPNQTIDAKADPNAAAEALNTGCADTSKCTWKNDTAITSDYGEPRILGDVLYNCSDDEYAETAVGVKDTRGESTSLAEKVSLKISLKFIGLAGTSVEAEVNSKQLNSFEASVSVTNAVAVPPGYKGWTVTQVLSANVTGSAYVTAGINNLVQVENIDLSFAGYNSAANKAKPAVRYIGVKDLMSADDVKASCDTSTVSGAALLRRAQAPQGKFKLGLCRRSGRCTSREVAGSLPPRVRRATALLTRAGRTYGRGTYAPGHTRLDMRRPLKAGTYKLTLRERPGASQQIGSGPLSAIETIVPITVG
jgi:hypothetical protein